MKHADNLKDALHMQAALIAAEARGEDEDGAAHRYFTNYLAGLERAIELYDQGDPVLDAQIALYEELLESLHRRRQVQIGAQLAQERASCVGWSELARELQDPDLDYTDWLNW